VAILIAAIIETFVQLSFLFSNFWCWFVVAIDGCYKISLVVVITGYGNY
jgi:hypothetical protein